MSSKISELKKKLPFIIKEVNSLPSNSLFRPSALWKNTNFFFNFLKHLPDSELESIRIHTSVITGSSILDFVHHPKRLASDYDKQHTFWAASQYEASTKNIPTKYHLSEPAPNWISEQISLPYKKHLISNDLVRYQRFIANLYNLGISNYIDKKIGKTIILEIGSGYGALAHQIKKIFNDTVYILVDLPELLFWAGVFIIVNNPKSKIFIYDPRKHKKKLNLNELKKYDFLLVPNYKLSELIGDIPIDLAINLLSFQEMTIKQINYYCKYISSNLIGFFGSDNMDRHPINCELNFNIDTILRKYFKLIPSEVDFIKIKSQNENQLWQVYSFFGVSKKNKLDFKIINNEILGLNYSFIFDKVDFFGSSIRQSKQRGEILSKIKTISKKIFLFKHKK